ncbi:MAG: hypothetical protein JWP97_6408 [Labilithrix sp.]|nr:hypothetical protein [Labilithrix sp.]
MTLSLFDLRFRTTQPWDAARRRAYLLRDDVAHPRSVDVMVWPSVFDWGQGIGLPAAVRRAMRLDGIAPTDAEPWLGGFWHAEAPMLACARAAGVILDDVVILSFGDAPNAVALDEDDLGFDVVDEGFLSGLMDEGFEPGEREALQHVWAPRLNRHHLFDDWADAAAFVAITDARVPRHAPHRVIRMRAGRVGT